MEGSTSKLQVSDEIKAQRRAGGVWLRSLRERAGLSQRMAAEKLGYPFYSLISQIENGIGRAQASQADAVDFNCRRPLLEPDAQPLQAREGRM